MAILESRRSWVVILLTTLLVLGGCSSYQNNHVHKFVKKVRSQSASSIKSPPKIKSYKPFTFQTKGRRDPFEPVHHHNKNANGPRPNPNRKRGPLEHYALGSLKMKGILKVKGVTYALIEAPTGEVYRVNKGQYIGKHSGKIKKITSTGLKLRELVHKKIGGYKKKMATLNVGQSSKK